MRKNAVINKSIVFVFILLLSQIHSETNFGISKKDVGLTKESLILNLSQLTQIDSVKKIELKDELIFSHWGRISSLSLKKSYRIYHSFSWEMADSVKLLFNQFNTTKTLVDSIDFLNKQGKQYFRIAILCLLPGLATSIIHFTAKPNGGYSLLNTGITLVSLSFALTFDIKSLRKTMPALRLQKELIREYNWQIFQKP